MVHDAEAAIALDGGVPFDQPHTSLRTVAVLYSWAPLQFIVSREFAEKYGVTSLEDIVVKKAPLRLLLNRRGNISSQIGEAMINAAGATLDDIAAWGGAITFAASEEQGDLMRDRRADALLNSIFVGHSSILQVADALDVVLLPISEQTANTVARQFKIKTFTIPAGAYAWSPRDTLTVTLSAHLFVLENYPDEIVGDITAALISNIGRMRDVHNEMQPLNVELMASSTTIPYHDAAVRAYRAAGYMN
jgi:TRAP transporter TAXI family solute receptor